MKRKRYRLTKAGRESLRATGRATAMQWQPWRWSTGPRTEEGKRRSAGNALKHGARSRAVAASRREMRALAAQLRAIERAREWDSPPD